MIKGFFPLILILLAACQTYNSNTGDRAKYAPVELEDNPQFRAAYQVIQNRCVNCHTGEHNNWATYTDSQKWIQSGRVNPGRAAESNLVIRTINSGNTNSNMPPTGGPLPNDEYQVILDWINGLQ